MKHAVSIRLQPPSAQQSHPSVMKHGLTITSSSLAGSMGGKGPARAVERVVSVHHSQPVSTTTGMHT
jgi:hypothetical protein